MFKNTFQKGLLTLFHSTGANPLLVWDSHTENGHIKRITDEDIHSIVLEMCSSNVSTTLISSPARPHKELTVKLPFLVLIVKNLKKYFCFEVQVRDEKNLLRRLRFSNFQRNTSVNNFCATMPLGLADGWNTLYLNLADMVRRCYGTSYIETVRVQINANTRIRCIYFSDRLYTDDELPSEFTLKKRLKKCVNKAPPKAPKKVASKKKKKEESGPDNETDPSLAAAVE